MPMRAWPGTGLLTNVKHEALHRSDGWTRNNGGIPGSLFKSNFSKEIFIISWLQPYVQILTPLKFGIYSTLELGATFQDTIDLSLCYRYHPVFILSWNFKYDYILMKENAVILNNFSYTCEYTDGSRQEVGSKPHKQVFLKSVQFLCV